jgi:hypothetical protein
MLIELFPTTHLQYASVPILGPVLEGYGAWLLAEGHSSERVRAHCHTARRLARMLVQRGVGNLTELTHLQLRGFAPRYAREDAGLAALVHSLERYFESELSLFRPRPLGPAEQRVEGYATYLKEVRGLAPATITRHRSSAAAFLAHLGCETSLTRVATLTAQDVEAFVRLVGQRLGRRSLHNVVAELRSYRTGLDVDRELPKLSTYLGHVHTADNASRSGDVRRTRAPKCRRRTWSASDTGGNRPSAFAITRSSRLSRTPPRCPRPNASAGERMPPCLACWR